MGYGVPQKRVALGHPLRHCTIFRKGYHKVASFELVVHAISRVSNRISQFAVTAMMIVVVGNILLRILWRPIYGTYDVVMLLMTPIAFALGYCAVQRGHISVELIVTLLPNRVQAMIDSLTGVLSVGIFAIVAWQVWLFGTDMWNRGEVTLSVHIPVFPFIYGVSVGCAVLSLVVLVDFIKAVEKLVRK